MNPCPLGHRCESCGIEAPDLTVTVHTAPGYGPYCLTSCRRCAASDIPPPIQPATAARLVRQHAAHLNGPTT